MASTCITQRHIEFRTKLENVIKDRLGADADNIFYIELLATSPACQGRGFGSKLVEAVANAVRA